MKSNTRSFLKYDWVKFFLLGFITLGVQLSSAQTPTQVKDLKIPFQAIEHFPEQLSKNWLDKSILQVKYGPLSEENFHQLKAAFLNSSEVTYDSDPKKEYHLIDFLPPAAQAVLNHIMSVETISIELNTQSLQDYHMQGYSGVLELQTVSNCWNTAIEFLMSMYGKSKSFQAYLPSPLAFERFLATGTKVSALNPSIGDMIVYKSYSSDLGEDILEHVAIVIGNDLVFEKTQAYGDSPFRISSAKAVYKDLQVRVEEVGGEVLEPVYYRFSKSTIKRVDSELIGALREEGLGDIIPHLKAQGIDANKVYMGIATNMSDKIMPFPQIVKKFPLTLNPENQRHLIESTQFKKLTWEDLLQK